MRKKGLALLLSLGMVLSMAGCGNDANNNNNTTGTTTAQGESTEGNNSTENTTANNTGNTESKGTVVYGTGSFNGVFSPFFYQTNYDSEAFQLVFETVSELNENSELVDNAGHIEAEEVTDENGNVQTLYTITIQDGMVFSDGEPVTIDDLLFQYYVLLDPTYDGMGTFRTRLDIVGANEYYYDDPNYSETVSQIQADAEAKAQNQEDFIAYLVATNLEGWFDGTLPGDVGDGRSWVQYLQDEGYDTTGIENDAAKMLDMLALCEYEHYKDGYDAVAYYTKELSKDYIASGLSDGIDVPTVSGINKVDDLTCTVLVNGINVTGDQVLALTQLTPSHYYDPDFKKGDLSKIKEKNGAPLGSGPFVFQSYENNVVTLKANPNYRLGAPKIEYFKLQYINEEQKMAAILNNEIDITEPSASKEVMKELKDEEIPYTLVDFPGYGYIAISAKRVPDLKVREGLMHLMTREQSISTYYGELAKIIERPMTPTLPEYPADATEYWGYDKDKALECFKEAGYEQVDGKLVKDGKQLVVEVAIGEASDHPSIAILTQMANDLKELGGELIISDLDFSILSNRVSNDDVDMWVMAWGNTTDCDLTQLFGSDSVKMGGSNRTWVVDPELDKMMIQVMQTLDLEERRALVAQELDKIMSWATYMPVYQRQILYVYNPETINMDSIPSNTSTFYNFFNEIEKLEIK